jgi:hypothetical protein
MLKILIKCKNFRIISHITIKGSCSNIIIITKVLQEYSKLIIKCEDLITICIKIRELSKTFRLIIIIVHIYNQALDKKEIESKIKLKKGEVDVYK